MATALTRTLMRRVLCVAVLTSVGACDGGGERDRNITHADAVATNSQEPPSSRSEETARVETATVSLGEDLYVRYCADCHRAGPGHPGTMRLMARLGATQAVLRERSDLHPEYVQVIVRNGYQMMPPFRPTEITDAELAALAHYVARADRATGDLHK